jgi:hypothetical protein
LPKIWEYKEKKLKVSNGRYLYSPWSCVFVSTKRRKPLDVDFDGRKELIDEKAIADAQLQFIKAGVQKNWSFGPFIKWDGCLSM